MTGQPPDEGEAIPCAIFHSDSLRPVEIRENILRLSKWLAGNCAGASPGMTGKSLESRHIKPIGIVQPPREKYSSFVISENVIIISAFRAVTRGVTRRHETWCGMRWTWTCRLTSGTNADGEVVWSWRAHAGAKFSDAFKAEPRMTVANAGSPGRARISCKTTAQGRPG